FLFGYGFTNTTDNTFNVGWEGKKWTLDTNGLTFPDATIQTTAATPSPWTDDGTNTFLNSNPHAARLKDSTGVLHLQGQLAIGTNAAWGFLNSPGWMFTVVRDDGNATQMSIVTTTNADWDIYGSMNLAVATNGVRLQLENGMGNGTSNVSLLYLDSIAGIV